MNRIFYSLAGEGLGHACRTQAIIENLEDLEVHLFTWGEAYQFFHKQNYPHLHKIKGIPFGRNEDNAISMPKTINNFLDYRWHRKSSVKYVLAQARKLCPCLFVSDFENVLPQAARKFGKPLLSIDNQHKFSRTIDKTLPFDLRVYAFFMGLYSEWTCPKPDLAVVSTFYHSAVRKKYCNRTVLTNCFMRKSIENIQPTTGDYVLVYYKPSVGAPMLQALKGEKVVVFNCPPDQRVDGFEYHNVSGEEFCKSLAGCKAVFCASGNQLLGEAAFYGKPCFTIPEPNQPEQRINAHYIAELKYGVTTPLDKFKPEMVTSFLQNLHLWQHKPTINGVHVAVDQIRKYSKVQS